MIFGNSDMHVRREASLISGDACVNSVNGTQRTTKYILSWFPNEMLYFPT